MNIDCRDSDRGYNSVSKPGGDDRARILGTRSFGECRSTHAIDAANDRHLEMDGSLVQFMASLSGMSPSDHMYSHFFLFKFFFFYPPLRYACIKIGDRGSNIVNLLTVSRVSPLRRLGC